MTRLIQFEQTSAFKIEYNNQVTWICRCGISKDFTFCDGSHNKVKDETQGTIYIYDLDQNRIPLNTTNL